MTHDILDSLNSSAGDLPQAPQPRTSSIPGNVPREGNPALLEGLTDPQRRAVVTTQGPVLILAAAGSGKTRVITRRIAYLLSLGVPSWRIVALTFTNKAAGEMRERVGHVLTSGAMAGRLDPDRALRGLTVTTFHALCARLLRRYAPAMEGAPGWGLKADYTIYDSDDQAALVKKVIAELGMSTSNWPPRSVLSAISGAKNQLLDAKAFAARAADFNTRSIAKIFEAYERALKAANAADFDDLLVLTVRLLRESEPARSEVQDRWRYLMIDEYQDTNTAQFVLSTLIVGKDPRQPQPNVCVVGDPDQSIYGWRGADISNILDFEEAYPGAVVIPLGENFRSRAPILKAADTLIRNNKKRKHKDLFTKRPGGDKPRVVLCRDERHEASLVVDWLKVTVTAREDISWKDTAVFYRNNSLSRVMEDALRAAGIPYVIARGTAFYQREEVKDALAYLRAVANPLDEISLRRIVNKPARKIGAAAIERVENAARAWHIPLIDAMRACDKVPDLGGPAVSAVRKFVSMLDEWTGGGSFLGASVPESLHDLVARVIKESGLEEHYRKAGEKNEEDGDKLGNLDELVSSAREFELEYDAGNDPVFADASGVMNTGSSAAPPAALTEGEPDALPNFLADLAGDGVDVRLPEPVGPAFTPPLLAMLRAYLESVSLVADADKVDPARGAVTLMTLHAAKGLEFHAVAMIGLEEGLLPSIRALESDSEAEEERRLCFVGITRAMEHLLITSAKYRTQRGLLERTIPSRFLEELPKDGIDMRDESDEFGSFNQDDDGHAWGKTTGSFDTGALAKGNSSPKLAGTWSGAPSGGQGRSAPVPYPVGCTVRHPQFGTGRVESLTGMGPTARAKIVFRDVGAKTLVLQYARLERVD